jgi:ferredoxin--NADP+ reductase
MYGTIHERTQASDDLMVLRIIPEQPVAFTPGQFMSLGVEREGRIIHRAYSIVSAPHEPWLEFFIERVPNGNLTPLLWDMKVGNKLQLMGRAAGVMTLNDNPGKRHLFLATVTGAAPFISILRDEKVKRESGGKDATRHAFLLIHGASKPEDFGPYKGELSALAEEEWFDYVPTVSRVWDTVYWDAEIGRVEDVIRKHADTHAFTRETTESYVCGHPTMVHNAEELLKRAGFPPYKISTEIYFKAK